MQARTHTRGGGPRILDIEEQFYLLLPLLALLLRNALTVFLVLVLTISLLPYLQTNPPVRLRVAGLVVGVLLAQWEGSASHLRLEPRWLQRGWLRTKLPTERG